ncbi:MAG: hypothetical protein Q9172_004776 [Xanthocarpia lactea]
MFELDKVANGEQPVTRAFLARAVIFLKLQFAIIVLFWTTVWVVKVSFLIFYRQLFTGLPEHMLGWWLTSGFTAMAYLLCWAFQLGACETPRDIRYSNACLYVAAAGDIASDLMSESWSKSLKALIDTQVVMGLGLRLLWNLQISAREKVALGAIFSVGLIKITFAVIRVVKIGASATHVNPIWLALWTMIEASVAIVVASLPSFRVLFAHGRRQSEVRRAMTLKTFHRRRSERHSDEMIEPLEGEIPSEGPGTPATGNEEAQQENLHGR